MAKIICCNSGLISTHNIKPMDLRDIAIVDSIPRCQFNGTILTIGCGAGRLEYYLGRDFEKEFNIMATDLIDQLEYDKRYSSFDVMDIFNPNKVGDVVICSEVLEHLVDYKTAFKNLIEITRRRLIITVPYDHSFFSPDHVNFWTEENVGEFAEMAKPYLVMISKIRTKPRDREMNQWGYLIIVDKLQKYEG